MATAAPVPRLAAFAYTCSLSSADDTFRGHEGLEADERSEAFLLDALVAAGQAYAVTITAEMGAIKIPKTYRQAMQSEHASYWREAVAKELGGLIELHTWDLVPLASIAAGANVMHSHFIFTVKRKADGSIEKFKARLVADGNTQKHGVDFDRVFSTVVKTLTIRLVLAIAAARDYNLSSIDIRQAYLCAELDGDLYMRVPPGVSPYDSSGKPLVCKLRRSLYGLKQAGREWSILFASFLLKWGFERSTIDTCLFIYNEGNSILWMCIYVDDGLCCDNDPALRARFVKDLSARFPTEDKGELSWILNVAVRRDRSARTLSLSQELYVSDLLTKFDAYVDPSSTRRFDSPLEEGSRLWSDDSPAVGSEEHAEMAPRREAYMSIVGGLLWLANMTRPDLAFAASQLARFLTNPGAVHFAAAVRVLIYLRDSRARTLDFTPNVSLGFECYVDSSWGSRFSCSGAFLLYHGCVVAWFSKMQKSVSLSSAEAEYFGAMLAAREVIFVRELLIDLGIELNGASTIYCDSKSAVDMAFDPVAFKNTKHVMRAAEFLRDLVAREVVTLKHVAGRVMIADILTKAQARAVFVELLNLLDRYAVDGIVCP